MDQLCIRCARRSLTSWKGRTARAQVGSRSFVLSSRVLEDKKPQGSGVAQSGTSISAALNTKKSQDRQTQQPLIRRVSDPGRSSTPRTASSTPQVRRSSPQQDGQRRPQNPRPVLRRSSPSSGQVLRRTGPPGGAQILNRTRTLGAPEKTSAPRPAGTLLRRQGQDGRARQAGASQPGQKGQKGPDRRRRRTPRNDEEEHDERNLQQQMDDYVAKYVDRPANPTEPLPYNPTKLTLNDLKSDWPNTPISASGMTESVVQKIEWLARRLPHGYQSPEQIAEHYLKGNLTRFESEEEKQIVLQLASEMSKKTKIEAEDGTLHKHEAPRYRVVEDAAFTSLASKAGDKSHLVDMSIKGSYAEAQQQKYAFMHTAERMLTNNETYGWTQAQKLLARVQSLIPQGRTESARPAKRA